MAESQTSYIEGGDYLQNIRNQYEDYPYPLRNPEDEKKRFRFSLPELSSLNHHCFGGKVDFSKGFRILDAGGGTGDCTIYMAEQLRHAGGGEVVYLDMSSKSLAICKERAAVRKLDNIRFVHGSLLDVAKMDIGKFDYIMSTGVLHHLKSPEDGLRALSSVLNENGSMFIMLYGLYGRTAVYQTQTLLRHLFDEKDTIEQKLDMTKRTLASMPNSNLMRAQIKWWQADLQTFGDIGIYDLLLHEQDRAYTVDDVYDFVESAGLSFKIFAGIGNIEDLYTPNSTYVKDEKLREKLSKLPKRRQQAFMEIFTGTMRKHCFYCGFKPYLPPTPEDTDMVPFWSPLMENYGNFRSGLEGALHKPVQMGGINGSARSQLTPTEMTLALMDALDGKRTIAQVLEHACKDKRFGKHQPTQASMLEAFKQLYNAIHYMEWMFLRAPGVPNYPGMMDIQKHVSAMYGTEPIVEI